MADVFTKQVLQNGLRNYIAVYTVTFTATTPISLIPAADPTSTGDMGVSFGGNVLYPGAHLKIWALRYNLANNLSVDINWEATANQTAWTLTGFGKQMFKEQGGLSTIGISGATGKIDLAMSATAPAVGNTITIEMWLKKDIAQ